MQDERWQGGDLDKDKELGVGKGAEDRGRVSDMSEKEELRSASGDFT